MTKAQLKERIKVLDELGVPDEIDIFIRKVDRQYEYIPFESMEVRQVTFKDGRLKAVEPVIVVTDE